MTLFTPTSLFKASASLLLFTLMLVLSFTLAVRPSSALQVTGLYSHRIAVNNESDSERNRAFADAFAAVVVKVTGERRWLQHPVIEQAKDNAQSYIEAFSYTSETIVLPVEPTTDDPDTPPGAAITLPITVEQRVINVNFAAELIDELLAGANIPVWDSNRPSVLVWMALQNEAGERSLLTAESAVELLG